MSTQTLKLASALLGENYTASGPVELQISDGRIASIKPLADTAKAEDLLALPSFHNAHDHGRPISTTSFGAANKPLESWLPRLFTMGRVDPYAAIAAPLARGARGGCSGIMVHQTKPMTAAVVDEANIVAQAAADVGVHVALAISMKDMNPLLYGDHGLVQQKLSAASRQAVQNTYLSHSPAPLAEQIGWVEQIAARWQGKGLDVQFGPNGVQWCSREMLEAIAEASASSGLRVHMHLLETRYQRAFSDQQFPEGVVPYLAKIGLLSPRITLAHCVWARPEELEIIADCGARISVNASSNLHLRSGIADVSSMLKAGVKVCMGIDGSALDEDDDALRELRLMRLLNAGKGFPQDMTYEQALQSVARNGRAALGLAGNGTIAVGEPADLLLLDLQKLDRDRIMDVNPKDYLFCRATAGHIVKMLVGGRVVVEQGQLSGVDLAALENQLRQEFRAELANCADLRAHWDEIERGIESFYHEQLGCC